MQLVANSELAEVKRESGLMRPLLVAALCVACVAEERPRTVQLVVAASEPGADRPLRAGPDALAARQPDRADI